MTFKFVFEPIQDRLYRLKVTVEVLLLHQSAACHRTSILYKQDNIVPENFLLHSCSINYAQCDEI